MNRVRIGGILAATALLPLTVVNRGQSERESNTFQVGLETGTGPSARRWSVLTVQQQIPGDGEFVSARWSDADHIRITTDAGYRVYTVDPDSGEPALAESSGRVRPAWRLRSVPKRHRGPRTHRSAWAPSVYRLPWDRWGLWCS
ncbi:hypothetical protein ACIQOW_16755 [Kitasatospora sp. NPDC091335]|uniref:hypothetical protein n=1 Tax=Kitasatospora sp. NPDC091335 TaxID=3364085 RepID=UPI0037F79E6E